MSAVDLVYSQTPLTSGELVFGDETGAPQPRTVSISGSFAPLTVDAFIGPLYEATISGSFAPLTVAVYGDYDNRTTRYLHGALKALHNEAVASRPSVESQWGLSTPKRGGHDVRHQPAVRSGHDTDSRVGLGDNLLMLNDLPAGIAQRQSGAQTTVKGETGINIRNDIDQHWQVAGQIKYSESSRHQSGINRRRKYDAMWQPGARIGHESVDREGASLYQIGSQFFVSPWQLTREVPPGREIIPVIPVVPPCYTPDPNLLFSFPATGAATIVFQCGDYIPVPEPVVVPIKAVYIMINTATLTRVDGNISIPTFGMSLTLDTDSWTWGFSASLPGSALSSIEPGGPGEPVEVEAVINGVAYRALIEQISRDRSFGRDGLRVSGRGKAAVLDSPYAPTMTFGNSITRTAQQLMEDALTLNGQSIGWGVSFGLTDWAVPAGAWSHQGSYISALNAIARAAGGYVQPHRTAQSLSILSRYPSAPWEWGSVIADYELPSSVTTRESIEWVEKADYNRVFVSGTAQGILGQVTRTGTAGDLEAPMITDALITHVDAARQRGIAALSDTGRQARVTLRLPVLEETGIIAPGKFISYVDGSTTRIGLTRSVSVDVGTPAIWQTLQLETHV